MQDRHETNHLKTLLGDALQRSGIDPRIIDAFEMGYVTETSFTALNNWFMEDYSELRERASAHELSWGDELRRKLIFLKNRTDLHTHQNLILANLAAILKNTGSSDKEFIDSLAKGQCAGFSVLVSYALWLESQPKPDRNKPRDDWTWVKSVFDLLVTWTPEKTFSAAQTTDINRMLALIRGFQYAHILEPVSQGSLVHATDTQDRQFLKLFAIGSKFTDRETQILLDKIETLNPEQPDFQILVGSDNHALSINRIHGNYIFYDSNNMTGPMAVESTDLAFLISVSNSFSPLQTSPLGISVFSTNKNLRFPDISVFLAETEEVKEKKWLQPDNTREQRFSALDMATIIGSNESARFLLQKDFPLNIRTTNGETALDFGIFHHQADIVALLLANGASLNPAHIDEHLTNLANTHDLPTLRAIIHARKDEIFAPLYNLLDRSVRQNRGDIIETVLQDGLELTQNEIKEFAMLAAQMDNVHALSALMQHGANPLAAYAPHGENLLHYAVKHDRIDMVKLLLKHIPPSQMNTKRNDGLTALQLAHNPEIRTLLTTHAHTPSVYALFTHTKPAPIFPTESTVLKNKPK